LADYISTNLTRPIIIKIHHDLFFSPKNGVDDVGCLDKNFSKNLKDIFKYYTPLVIGYGGNDGSLMNFLEELEHFEESIFWFFIEGNKPNERIINLVRKACGKFVPIKGFDDLMIQLGDKLELQKLDTEIERIAKKRADNYRDQIDNIKRKETTDKETKEAMTSITSRGLKTWWNYDLLARDEKDEDKANGIYLQGIKEFPNNKKLINNYAVFLSKYKKQYDDAEKYYHKALEIDPEDAIVNGSYANFLSKYKEQYDDAEKYYLKSLGFDPNIAKINGNYANFLADKRKKYDDAEKYYLKALKIDPKNAKINGNYANLLFIQKKYDDAEKYYLKALKIDPKNANIYGNYANFLSDERKQYDDAEKYFLKALEIDPKNANIYGNYAKSLIISNQKKKAKEYIDKALNLNKDAEYDLLLELLFYIYAVFFKEYPKSKTKVEELIAKGIKSIGWDLSEILKIAEKEKHPDYQQLVEFEKKITQY